MRRENDLPVRSDADFAQPLRKLVDDRSATTALVDFDRPRMQRHHANRTGRKGEIDDADEARKHVLAVEARDAIANVPFLVEIDRNRDRDRASARKVSRRCECVPSTPRGARGSPTGVPTLPMPGMCGRNLDLRAVVARAIVESIGVCALHRAYPRLDRAVELCNRRRHRMQEETLTEQWMRNSAARENSRRAQRAGADDDRVGLDAKGSHVVRQRTALQRDDAASSVALRLDA